MKSNFYTIIAWAFVCVMFFVIGILYLGTGYPPVSVIIGVGVIMILFTLFVTFWNVNF